MGKRCKVILMALILGASVCEGSQEPGPNKEQGVLDKNTCEQQLGNLVKDLPQNYVVTQDYYRLDDKNRDHQTGEQGILKVIRYDFVSKNPVKETKGGGVFLKANITYTEYEDQQQVGLAMQEIQKKAHPDMGLTYEWDYIVHASDSIYHLHAGCLFSEQSFYKMVASLDEIIVLSEKKIASSIQCRCGGGCTMQDRPGEQ